MALIVMQGIGVNAQVDTEFPRSLADVVGNTYTFQLKLKDFNFTPNHQTFTVSRIFPAQELAPIPSFAVRSDTTPDVKLLILKYLNTCYF